MLNSRLTHALWAAFMVLIAMLMFSCAGWTLTNFTPDPQVVPTWLWNLNFTIMMLAGLVGTIYYAFKLLDELFYPADSRQRITGRRMTPTKARPVTVTWRDR